MEYWVKIQRITKSILKFGNFEILFLHQLWTDMVSDVVRGEGEASGEPEPYHILAAETKLKVLQICANIVDYCRVAMTMGGGLTQITNRNIKCLRFAKQIVSKRKGIFFSVLSRYLLARLDITVDQSEKR